ncbi:hypothetical protein ACJRO7_008541 [Eucalyptus globulus]|uniref:Uncharacterized protein n=1 Tax=Eucalyptus globulus TaxID=34317 RepID=A0ABD3ITH6_EUCGL
MRARHVVKRLQREVLYLLRVIAIGRTNHTAREPAGKERGRVKDGCFSVVATDGNSKPKKFSVALEYLAHPPFVKLLDAAEAEFGFSQKGVLVIPCEARVLQNILSSSAIVGKKKC